MKTSRISRPTEAAALAHMAPRTLPPISDLLWALAATEERRDAEGRYLLGHLVVRAARAVQR